MARSGSILSPSLEPAVYQGAVETGEPTLAPQPTKAPAPIKTSSAIRPPSVIHASASARASKPVHARASAWAPKPGYTPAMARASKPVHARAMAWAPKPGYTPAMAWASQPVHASAVARTRVRTTPNQPNAAKHEGADFFSDIPPENILSITDRRLDEVPEPAEKPVVSKQEQPRQAEPPQPTTKAQLVQSVPAATDPQVKPTGGWVARNSGVVRP
jgi:hypothetical protein